MSQPLFEIGADGIDTEALVRDIRDTVEQKIRDGVFPDPSVAQAEKPHLAYLGSVDTLMDYYMGCLRQAVFVDINDFEIRERRRFGSGMLKRLKHGIWSLLRFYTYRLWSQQNQANGLLVAAVDGIDQKSARKLAVQQARIDTLEQRIAELESKLGSGP
jgi:hypothetical protein